MFRKLISLVLTFGLFFQQACFAQLAAELNLSGYLNRMQSSMSIDKFRPLHLRYFNYDLTTHDFKVLIDKGDLKNPKALELENSTQELLNYFLVGLTLNNESFWVNLRPDSEDQIIDPYLAQTDVGKIMLEADLQLKKDTAKLTSPETPEGKEYWNRLYKKAEELLGYENISIPTLTRPWIVPGEIIIHETDSSAYIYKATLKVMLEQDYLKDSVQYNFKDPRLKALNEYSSELIRELIIPKLTKEVNSSKRYAPARQVYYSLILSRWFKNKFAGQTGGYASRINTMNLSGLTSKTPWSKTTYFQQYQKSFKDGEYNIKEPVYTPTGQVIRSYFSGGIKIAGSPIDNLSGINSKTFREGQLPHLGDLVIGNANDRKLVSLPPISAGSPIVIKSLSAKEIASILQKHPTWKLPLVKGTGSFNLLFDEDKGTFSLTHETKRQNTSDHSEFKRGIDTFSLISGQDQTKVEYTTLDTYRGYQKDEKVTKIATLSGQHIKAMSFQGGNNTSDNPDVLLIEASPEFFQEVKNKVYATFDLTDMTFGSTSNFEFSSRRTKIVFVSSSPLSDDSKIATGSPIKFRDITGDILSGKTSLQVGDDIYHVETIVNLYYQIGYKKTEKIYGLVTMNLADDRIVDTESINEEELIQRIRTKRMQVWRKSAAASPVLTVDEIEWNWTSGAAEIRPEFRKDIDLAIREKLPAAIEVASKPLKNIRTEIPFNTNAPAKDNFKLYERDGTTVHISFAYYPVQRVAHCSIMIDNKPGREIAKPRIVLIAAGSPLSYRLGEPEYIAIDDNKAMFFGDYVEEGKLSGRDYSIPAHVPFELQEFIAKELAEAMERYGLAGKYRLEKVGRLVLEITVPLEEKEGVDLYKVGKNIWIKAAEKVKKDLSFASQRRFQDITEDVLSGKTWLKIDDFIFLNESLYYRIKSGRGYNVGSEQKVDFELTSNFGKNEYIERKDLVQRIIDDNMWVMRVSAASSPITKEESESISEMIKSIQELLKMSSKDLIVPAKDEKDKKLLKVVLPEIEEIEPYFYFAMRTLRIGSDLKLSKERALEDLKPLGVSLNELANAGLELMKSDTLRKLAGEELMSAYLEEKPKIEENYQLMRNKLSEILDELQKKQQLASLTSPTQEATEESVTDKTADSAKKDAERQKEEELNKEAQPKKEKYLSGLPIEVQNAIRKLDEVSLVVGLDMNQKKEYGASYLGTDTELQPQETIDKYQSLFNNYNLKTLEEAYDALLRMPTEYGLEEILTGKKLIIMRNIINGRYTIEKQKTPSITQQNKVPRVGREHPADDMLRMLDSKEGPYTREETARALVERFDYRPEEAVRAVDEVTKDPKASSALEFPVANVRNIAIPMPARLQVNQELRYKGINGDSVLVDAILSRQEPLSEKLKFIKFIGGLKTSWDYIEYMENGIEQTERPSLGRVLYTLIELKAPLSDVRQFIIFHQNVFTYGQLYNMLAAGKDSLENLKQRINSEVLIPAGNDGAVKKILADDFVKKFTSAGLAVQAKQEGASSAVQASKLIAKIPGKQGKVITIPYSMRDGNKALVIYKYGKKWARIRFVNHVAKLAYYAFAHDRDSLEIAEFLLPGLGQMIVTNRSNYIFEIRMVSVKQASSAIQATETASSAVEREKVSSPMLQENKAEVGGIDFRSLPMTIKPMGSFEGLNLRLPRLSSSVLSSFNITKELQQLNQMASSGIMPSGSRVQELVSAAWQKGQLQDYQSEILTLLAEICKLQEGECCESSDELKVALVVANAV